MAIRDDFLKQAETCLRLARGSTDRDTARELTDLAAELKARARQAESSGDRKEPDTDK